MTIQYLSVRMPGELMIRVRQEASNQGLSMSRYALLCMERCMSRREIVWDKEVLDYVKADDN
jgi:predicted DNA binding CopG/RHH family protein